MAITTNVLGGGIAFNEWHPVSFATDYNGSEGAEGAQDGYMEFINTSTTSTIDISGYQYWVLDNSINMVLAHTVPAGTSLAPGETYTIVSNSGSGGSPAGVSGQAAVADVTFDQTADLNLFLADPAGNFIVLTEDGGQGFLNGDIASAGLNAADQVGQDIVTAPTQNQSIGRFPDGDDTFTVQGPTPGDPNCFLAGTAIATADGEAAVETLSVGDTIVTHDGRAVRVKWVGRQTVFTRFGIAERLMPVRITAGALAHGVPHRDLVLTADHALLIDGLLINAGALVNGGSIDWVPLREFGGSYTVYHVETEHHDVLVAEGAPAETFIDYQGRRGFHNYAEYLDLYGDDRTIAEMPIPRVSAARLVPRGLRDRLASARSA
jgi:hypothetical protein